MQQQRHFVRFTLLYWVEIPQEMEISLQLFGNLPIKIICAKGAHTHRNRPSSRHSDQNLVYHTKANQTTPNHEAQSADSVPLNQLSTVSATKLHSKVCIKW